MERQLFESQKESESAAKDKEKGEGQALGCSLERRTGFWIEDLAPGLCAVSHEMEGTFNVGVRGDALRQS